MSDSNIRDALAPWLDRWDRVDVDAVRAGTPDLADAPAILESLCDEVERLRGPRRCHAGRAGDPCRPQLATSGTTSASLGDYDSKLGDAAVETYLARCKRCGAVFVGIAPGGVYSDEPGFADRVQWVPVTGAEAGES